MKKQWIDFKEGRWTKHIDVRDFIQKNYTEYLGDDSFLKGATINTQKLWNEVSELFKKERENGGVLDVDTSTVSTISAYNPGYIDKAIEKIVGVQIPNRLRHLPGSQIGIQQKLFGFAYPKIIHIIGKTNSCFQFKQSSKIQRIHLKLIRYGFQIDLFSVVAS